MTRKRAAVALVATAALVLSGCGSDDGGDGGSDTPKLSNEALDSVVEPSDAKGGTLKFGLAGEYGDSTIDPGETYYGYSWDLLRNFTRSLVMFKPAPGKEGLELTPDLATDLGKSSDGGKTWTYTLKEGLKYEDGSPITSQDVRHAVERSVDKAIFKTAPEYFKNTLDWPANYKGAYKSKDMNTDSAIETPDDSTIIFHLKEPFAGFDYMATIPQTAPVPEAKDTGARYKKHVISSGPYMFKGDFDAATGFTLVRNPNWDESTDPNRAALPDQIDVKTGMDPADLDNQIIAGSIDVDLAGTGVQPASLTKVLRDEDLQARADNPVAARLWYTSIIGTVKPLDNIECRKAVIYGMSPRLYQNAYGGKFAGGEVASTMLPPMIPGYEDFDLYGQQDNLDGQADKAKEALEKCGKPDGFEINMGYRAERPKEKATAEAFQEALGKVGIKVTPKALPEGDYFPATCGKPSYVVENNIGLCTNGWAADWNDGYGFLSQLVDSRVIVESGGSSNLSVRIPEVDKLLDQAKVELDEDKRNALWGEIDKRVMEEAYVYPGLYAKGVLLRSKNATNVFVNDAFGYYDYTAMGVKQ